MLLVSLRNVQCDASLRCIPEWQARDWEIVQQFECIGKQHLRCIMASIPVKSPFITNRSVLQQQLSNIWVACIQQDAHVEGHAALHIIQFCLRRHPLPHSSHLYISIQRISHMLRSTCKTRIVERHRVPAIPLVDVNCLTLKQILHALHISHAAGLHGYHAQSIMPSTCAELLTVMEASIISVQAAPDTCRRQVPACA